MKKNQLQAITMITVTLLMILSYSGVFAKIKQIQIPKNSIAFVTYDAGETLAFIPVFNKLIQNKQLNVKWIATATSVSVLQEKLSQDFYQNVITLESLGISRITVDYIDQDRENKLSDIELRKIVNQLQAEYTMLISGMVSSYQYQIGEKFQNSKLLNWVGYYDAFSNPGQGSIWEHFLGNNTPFTKILTPADSISKFIDERNQNLIVKTIGQPSVETWQQTQKTIDVQELRLKIMGEKNINKDLIVYAGQYGSGYEEGFSLFLDSVQGLNLNDYYVCIGLHPKSDGQLEQNIIQQYDMVKKIKILKKTDEFSLDKVASVSQVLVTMTSTSGVQSLFVSTPSIYLQNEGSEYTDIAIDNGLSPNCFDSGCFVDQIEMMKENNFEFDQQQLEKAGIPLNSSEIFQQYIQEQVQELNENI